MTFEQITHRGPRVQSYISADIYAKLRAIRMLPSDPEVIDAVAQQFLPQRLYVPRDIITALEAVWGIVGDNKTLDAIAAGFDLRRAPQYGTMPPQQIVIEAPERKLLR